MSDIASASADEGARRIQAGDFQGAVAVLQQVAADEPNNARAQSLLGVAYARSGNMNGAIVAFQAAAQLQPTDAAARFNLANALYQAQRYPEARAVAGAALSLNPAHENARQLIARIDAASQPAAQAVAQPLTSPAAVPLTGGYAPQTPQSQPSAIPWATGPVAPPPPIPGQGMQYNPQAMARPAAIEPSAGLRIARGLGWGLVYGQIWTIYRVISIFLFSAIRGNDNMALEIAFWIGFYAVFGLICGLIIGAANAKGNTGPAIGIGVGLVVCVIRALLFQSVGWLISVFFFFVTGRIVGAGIQSRVQQPIAR